MRITINSGSKFFSGWRAILLLRLWIHSLNSGSGFSLLMLSDIYLPIFGQIILSNKIFPSSFFFWSQKCLKSDITLLIQRVKLRHLINQFNLWSKLLLFKIKFLKWIKQKRFQPLIASYIHYYFNASVEVDGPTC